MEEEIKKYMVEFSIPTPFTQEMEGMIPQQQLAVHNLFMEEKLLTYTLALDRTKIWAIFLALDEGELKLNIDRLPMTDFMSFEYGELMFHETVQYIPTLSLN